MTKKIRVGIIGFGKIGKLRKKVIENNPDLLLESICDTVHPEPDDKVICKFFENYKDLLKLDIDAVFICVPHTLTKQIVIDSLKNNLHVFAEKPPGICVGDVLEIERELIRHPDLKLKFGFNHRYYTHIQNAKKFIDSGKLGRIQWIKGTYGRVALGSGWRLKKETGGHGILLSQGIHLVDLFRFLTGEEFINIKSFVSHFGKKWYEDNVFAIMSSANGVVASLHSSSVLGKNTFIMYVGFEKGYLCIRNVITSTRSFGFPEELTIADGDKTFFYGNPEKTITYYGVDVSWSNEIKDFVDSIINNKPTQNGSITDAYQNMTIIEGVYADGYK